MTKPSIRLTTVQDLKIVDREVVRLELSRADAELIFSLLSRTPRTAAKSQFGADVFAICDAMQAAGLKHNPAGINVELRRTDERVVQNSLLVSRYPWLAG